MNGTEKMRMKTTPDKADTPRNRSEIRNITVPIPIELHA
jgi:hypothetical protein